MKPSFFARSLRHALTALAIPAALALAATPLAAKEKDPVMGRTIIIGGGSITTSYIMPVVLSPYGRHSVIMGYITGNTNRGNPAFVFGEGEETMLYPFNLPTKADISYIMIQCSERTYSHYPYSDETRPSMAAFYNGDQFAWGNHTKDPNNSPHFFYASWGEEEMVRVFEDACK